MTSWKIVYDQFQPAQEKLREALCTLGNGYFGTRGAATESAASRIHYPGTYIAGVYNRLATKIAGKKVFNEDMVNCPNWLYLTFRFDEDEWISPSLRKILSYRQELDMKKGTLCRKILVENYNGQRTTIKTERIVHMANPHIAAIKYKIIPENYEGWLTIRSGLDGTVQNTGVARYRELNCLHLKPVSTGNFKNNGIYLSVKTNQSKIIISQAAKVRIFNKNRELRVTGETNVIDKKRIYQDFKIFVHKKQPYQIEKTVAIYTSKDKDIKNPKRAAINSAKDSDRFDRLFETHRRAWENLWKKFDVQLEGDEFTQKILRFHTFHILQTASTHNTELDVGLPARGLHGESYRGHIFWDELFVMPFFDLHEPKISRSLLLYRFRRLAQAKRDARRQGYKGAMFPWQSASSGLEETQVLHLNPMSGKWDPDYSHNQRHVSFAIAYNVWKYWKRTGDLDFLTNYGAEMILSIAQFGASLVRYSAKDKRYHTEGLMGPDEYHEKLSGEKKSGLRDNAYTNLLIVFTLIKAKEVINILPKKKRIYLTKKMGLNTKELDRWDDITRKMNIIINEDGIIGQFEGYFGLKELDWEAYKNRYGKIQRMDRILKAEGKSPNDYKVAKQADLFMIFYFLSLSEAQKLFFRLGYPFNKELLRKNYAYYIKRTSHGSTLSKVVYCYIAYQLGFSRESWNWFMDVIKSDIYDTQGGTTEEGIHAGVMGGSIDIIMRIFAGAKILDDHIAINPNLPKNWKRLKLNLCYKGTWISLSINRKHITVLIHGPKSKPFTVPVEIQGRTHYFIFGKINKISLKKGK